MSDVDAEEKARQERLAALKKRADQLKKKKKKTAAKKDESKDDNAEASAHDAAEEGSTTLEPAQDDDKPPAEDDDDDGERGEGAQAEESGAAAAEAASPAQASKLRSTSFRAGPLSPGPLSPDGDSAADIYRKHVARIEELERDNKRLVKEAADLEKRWQKSEGELADLREAEDRESAGKGDKDAETEKLRSEIASLERHNSQLQQQISRGHRQSVSVASPEPALQALQAELDAKSATIEAMEIEISKLKARADRHDDGASSEKEQILALEDRLARAESAAGKAQRELADVKKNLERATEKAVREGGERSSAETKAHTLEAQLGEASRARDELEKKADGLEKKAAALTTLHKEQDARFQAMRKDKERAEAEAATLRERAEKLATARRSTDGGGGLDDEGVDELENEERLRLERKIRGLEAEIHELRSGAWIERRREMEATSPGFHDVDLSGGGVGGGGGGGGAPPPRARGSVSVSGGIGELITHGLNALAGGGGVGGGMGGDDEFLDDDDMGFDEDAFRRAHEEESLRRLERIKELKRSLKHWEGWRLDIVDIRRGSGQGIGEVFDI